MPVLAEIQGSFSLTADARPTVPVQVLVTDETAPYIELTITEFAAVAASQRFQRLGVVIEALFDGQWIPFAEREIGREFTIEETTDQFGDTLKFQLVGPRFSPFARNVLRQRGGIRAHLVYGSPAHEYSAQVFEGFIVESVFSGTPPHADVTCLDAAGLYARRLAKDWTLPANSGRTRLDIAQELLGIGGIPYDLPTLGENGGGVINKPYAIGDTPIVVWLRDFLRVIGIEVGFIEGKFVAVRFDPNQQPVTTLHPGNCIPPDEIRAPMNLEPNVLGAVSVSVAYTDTLVPGAPEVVTTVIEAPYAPVAHVERQDNGVVGPPITGFSSPERMQTIYELVTRTTRLGTVEIRVEEEERQMYARRAARVFIDAVGDIQPNGGTVYIFPDGSTREQPAETLQTTRRMLRTKTLDANNNVVQIREERRPLRIINRSTSKVVLGVDEPTGDNVPLTDDGQGFVNGREYSELPFGYAHSPMEIDITDYILSEDGTISEERKLELSIGRGPKIRRAEDAWGYGTENTEYFSYESEVGNVTSGVPGVEQFSMEAQYANWRLTTKRYRPMDEDTFEVRESVIGVDGKPTVTTQQVNGSLPRPERAEPTTSTQEIRSMVKDDERIALSGEEIEAVEHNEFIQSQEEADFFARYLARMKSAIQLSVAMPLEGQVHKWRTVDVDLPASAIEGKRFYVRAVTRNAVTFSQAVRAEYYSPLLS